MNHIQDDHTLNALISVLAQMCAAFEKKIQKEALSVQDGNGQKTINYAFLEFLNNENFYREKILYITNRGNVYRLDKCLETINILLTKPESRDFFNINDLCYIIDICLNEI